MVHLRGDSRAAGCVGCASHKSRAASHESRGSGPHVGGSGREQRTESQQVEVQKSYTESLPSLIALVTIGSQLSSECACAYASTTRRIPLSIVR